MTAVSPTNELLSREQAAEYLGVAAQTLAVWACTGRHNLPFVKAGRVIRYRRRDLDAWLEARLVSHTGEAIVE